MGIAKANIKGNPFIGAFAVSTETFSIVGNSFTQKEDELIRKTLEVDPVRASVDGSDLIGLYIVANNNCVLMPNMANERELASLRKSLPEVRIERLNSDLNALGNNILANNKIAIINPEYSSSDAIQIGDALDAEVVKLSIGGFNTVGSNNILTDSGIVLCNRASENDIEVLKGLVNGISQSTANLGSLSLGLSAVANSKGLVVGKETSGYELARIAEGLGL